MTYTVRPSKSAHFVIHKLQEWQHRQGEGISVRVDGRAIAEIVWDGEAVDIISQPDPNQ